MQFSSKEMEHLVHSSILKTAVIGASNGPTAIIYKGRTLFVWKDERFLYLKEKGLFKKKYKVAIPAAWESPAQTGGGSFSCSRNCPKNEKGDYHG